MSDAFTDLVNDAAELMPKCNRVGGPREWVWFLRDQHRSGIVFMEICIDI